MNEKLKKYSPSYVLMNIGLSFLLPLIFFYIVESAFMGIEPSVIFSVSYIILNIVLAMFIGILYYACVFSWGDKQRRTMKKTERNYVKGFFPYKDSFYASHAFVYLNVEGGQMGVILGGNPYSFQKVDGRKIEKFWVDTRPMSKKLSRGVRFCIRVDGITLSCDTFITNTSFFMDSHWIKDGIKKAEYYCSCLEKLRQNANDIANGTYGSDITGSGHRADEFEQKYHINI